VESDRFDELTARLAAPLSRRRSVGLLGGAVLGSLAAVNDSDAKRKKEKKKKKKCKPICDGKTCGDDGCGGKCGSCGACQECQGGVCVPKTDGLTCGNECRVCQSGQCVARAEGAACGTDSCTTCQGGQCVAKADDSECPEQSHGLCRTGICRGFPSCIEYGNHTPCGQINCCYLNPGEICPPVIEGQQTCQEKGIAGRRCRFDNDCQSNSCIGYQCA
jgi:hypothetical protein